MLLVHAVKVPRPPKLRRCEENMKHGRCDLEGQCPPVPQRDKHVHGHNRLGYGSAHGCGHGREKQLAKEIVGVRIDPVQYDSDMWQELGDDIERACWINLRQYLCG